MVKANNFTPTSQKLHYIDPYQTAYKNTRISYQFGRKDGKKAVRFFFKGKPVTTRVKIKKSQGSSFDIRAYGGQYIYSAQMQREECLQVIITRLFEKLGFNVEIEPKLEQFTPDVLIKKAPYRIYIELKAYHKHNLCGDPEIAQAMKYFEMASRIEEESKEPASARMPPRVILITSGTLIDKHESVFAHKSQNHLKFVKKFYKKFILPRRLVNSMDKFIGKMMYIHAHKKFKKNVKIGLRKMNIKFPEDYHNFNTKEYILDFSNYDLLILDAHLFYNLLNDENLKQEAHYFRLIRQTRLEKLIINPEILNLT
ncbi:MAG: hypothetical protein GF383_10060 [Candidatus Lokiarchaeota archaeon]|nr:hypothetical protein [Candidatus Lokiarchaeota archaeon]MBD3340879.1 hypothetical protein [Candidatus Lokiarchaeota archaeon]